MFSSNFQLCQNIPSTNQKNYNTPTTKIYFINLKKYSNIILRQLKLKIKKKTKKKKKKKKPRRWLNGLHLGMRVAKPRTQMKQFCYLLFVLLIIFLGYFCLFIGLGDIDIFFFLSLRKILTKLLVLGGIDNGL
jgi:hypothetical protein